MQTKRVLQLKPEKRCFYKGREPSTEVYYLTVVFTCTLKIFRHPSTFSTCSTFVQVKPFQDL